MLWARVLWVPSVALCYGRFVHLGVVSGPCVFKGILVSVAVVVSWQGGCKC